MHPQYAEMAERLRMKLEKTSTPDDKLLQEIREFELQVDSYIEPIFHLTSELRKRANAFDKDANEMLLLRNMIHSLKGKKNGNSE